MTVAMPQPNATPLMDVIEPSLTAPTSCTEGLLHLDFVDALRGIAVLAVLMVHCALSVERLPSWAKAITMRGALGVQLFYLASAFTLFLSMSQRRARDKRPVVAFFTRRFFRIAPLFYCAIVLYLVVDGTGPRATAPSGIHSWQILLTFLFSHGWHPESINSVVPGGWSIAVEMTFYLLLPLLFLWITSLRRAVIFLLLTVALKFALNAAIKPLIAPAYGIETTDLGYSFLDFWLPSQLPIFAAGILFYFIFRELKPVHQRPLHGYFCLAAALAIAPLTLVAGRVFIAISFLLLAIALALHPSRLLVNPMTRYLGKISYSIYLLHILLVPLSLSIASHAHPNAQPIVQLVLVLVSTLLLVTLVATASFYLVEEPGRRLGSRILKRRAETSREAHAGSALQIASIDLHNPK